MTKIDKAILLSGAALGVVAVILGAFGAHGLEDKVPAKDIASFNTGVRYQMYHAILCLFLGLISTIDIQLKKRIYILWMIGVTLFSGSIYLLAVDEILGISLKSIWFLTPIGGSLLIVGWILLFLGFKKMILPSKP